MLGATLLAVLVVRNDPGEVFASIGRLSWRLGVLLCFPVTLVTIFDTLGWRFAFVRDRAAFRDLVWARLAGEAFNITTPTAALGGEVVKAWLLRGHVPLDESVPSVIIAKTTITIAQGLFLLLGIVLAGIALPGSPLLLGMQWLLAVEVVALAVFVVMQTRGFLRWGARLLERLGVRRLGEGDTVDRVDRVLAHFYRHEPLRLLLSVTSHLVAWLLGSIEAYLILRFLEVPVSLTTATVIEAFGTAVRVATFLIPASLGALEGSFVATFVALGLGPAAGVSFGLIRRAREIVWVGVGLVAFVAMRRVPLAVGRSPEPGSRDDRG